MNGLLESAEHWEALAVSAERKASRERDLGIDGSAPGDSAGDHSARTYRDCAKTLRHEHDTGVVHCICHLLPLTRVPIPGRVCEHT